MAKHELVKCTDVFFNARKKKMSTINISSVIKLAKSESPIKRKASIQYIRKLLQSFNNTPINSLIRSGIIPVLIGCLDENSNLTLQYEASWILTNITSGSTDQTLAVVEANAIPSLIKLLSTSNEYVLEQALLALGNIISEWDMTRDLVIEHKFFKPFLNLTITPFLPIKIMKRCAWIMEKLCRAKNPPLPQGVIDCIIPALKYLITHEDIDILTDGVKCVSYISTLASNELRNIENMIDSGIVMCLVPLLRYKQKKVVTDSLNALGNIATGTNEQTQRILDTGVLMFLPRFLIDPQTFNCRETLRFLANITAGNENQIQAVLDENLIPLILRALIQGKLSVKKEAAWTISNLSMHGNSQQIDYIIRKGVIPPFCRLLFTENIHIIKIVLEGLHNMLITLSPEIDALADIIEECGGLFQIEQLQNHESYDIYKTSYDLIKNYFSEDSA